MENNKIFLTINRINSVLFLFLLVIGLGGSYFLFNEITRSHRKNAVEVPSPNKSSREIIELSNVESVYGKDIQFIQVYSKKDGVMASGGYSRTLKNLLFLNPTGGEPTWLLPDNTQTIVRFYQLTTYVDNKSQTDYFYLEVASSDQGIKIGISNPDGTELSYVDSGITKVIEHKYFPKVRKLGVLVQVANELKYRVYDLKLLKRVSDKFVITL